MIKNVYHVWKTTHTGLLEVDINKKVGDHAVNLTDEELEYVLRTQMNAKNLQEFLKTKIEEYEGKP